MSATHSSAPAYLAVGRITGPHGIRGEVKVDVMTDFPERFRPGATLYLGAGTADPEARRVVVVSTRPHKQALLVRLDLVPDRNAAETLRDLYLLIPEADAMPLGEHENFAHDLVGLQVETADGEPLGALVEILFTRANDVYVVRGPAGEILLPALREVVLRVDLPAHKMVVAVPEGLRA